MHHSIIIYYINQLIIHHHHHHHHYYYYYYYYYFRDLFNQPKLRNVIDDPNSKSTKIVLLNPKVKTLELDNVSEEVREFVKKEGNGIVRHSIELNYDYWSSGIYK